MSAINKNMVKARKFKYSLPRNRQKKPKIRRSSDENKIPTIVGEEGMVDKGGLATYGINYYQLGRLAGELAETILVNKIKPGDIPVRYLSSSSCERKVNYDTAKLLGIEVK